MSILSATRKGTRCGVSVGTNSAFTPSASAILLPTSMSKPSQLPSEPRELMGGKFGLMPTRMTPALMMSSRDFASAVAPPIASAATMARHGNNNLFSMLTSLIGAPRRRPLSIPGFSAALTAGSAIPGQCSRKPGGPSIVYSMCTKIPGERARLAPSFNRHSAKESRSAATPRSSFRRKPESRGHMTSCLPLAPGPSGLSDPG